MRRSSTFLGAVLVASALTVAVAAAAPGKLDPGFGTGGVATTATAPGSGADFQNGMAIQPDGKILVSGSSDMGAAAGGGNWRVARYTKQGDLDPTFGAGGVVTTNRSTVGGDDEHIWEITLQPDGKIVAVGHARTATTGADWALARYNPGGTLDSSFGSGGTVIRAVGPGPGNDTLFEVLIDANGKIVVGGRATMSAAEGGRNFAVARYNPDGSLDGSFNPGGATPGIVVTPMGAGALPDQLVAMALDASGRIVVAGFADTGSGAGGANWALARYNPDGSLDDSFDGDGKLTTAMAPGDNFEFINVLAIDGNGKIVAGGDADVGSGPENFDWVLARFDADGSPDGSFSGDGKLLLPVGASDDDLESIVIQPDGRIVAGGSSSASGFGTDDDFTLARFLGDGTLDATLGSGGIAVTPMGPGSDTIFDITAQSDAKIVASGECDMGATGVDVCVARYKTGEGD